MLALPHQARSMAVDLCFAGSHESPDASTMAPPLPLNDPLSYHDKIFHAPTTLADFVSRETVTETGRQEWQRGARRLEGR